MTPVLSAKATVAPSMSLPVTRQPHSFSASATDEPISPSPTTWARRLFGEVIAQRLSVTKIDVTKIATRTWSVDVHHHPHGERLGTRNVDLTRAQQRHVAKTNSASSRRWKGHVEIRGGREQNANDVVVSDAVAFEHRGQQLLRDFCHFGRVVGLTR